VMAAAEFPRDPLQATQRSCVGLPPAPHAQRLARRTGTKKE